MDNLDAYSCFSGATDDEETRSVLSSRSVCNSSDFESFASLEDGVDSGGCAFDSDTSCGGFADGLFSGPIKVLRWSEEHQRWIPHSFGAEFEALLREQPPALQASERLDQGEVEVDQALLSHPSTGSRAAPSAAEPARAAASGDCKSSAEPSYGYSWWSDPSAQDQAGAYEWQDDQQLHWDGMQHQWEAHGQEDWNYRWDAKRQGWEEDDVRDPAIADDWAVGSSAASRTGLRSQAIPYTPTTDSTSPQWWAGAWLSGDCTGQWDDSSYAAQWDESTWQH